MRLGEAERTDDFAPRHARQVALLLLFAAVREDRVHAERRLHRDETAQARIAAFEFLADEAIAHGVHARTAEALERAAEQAEPRELTDQFFRKGVILEMRPDDRQHGVVDEARHGVLHHALLFGERGADVVQVEGVQGVGRHGGSRSESCSAGAQF